MNINAFSLVCNSPRGTFIPINDDIIVGTENTIVIPDDKTILIGFIYLGNLNISTSQVVRIKSDKIDVLKGGAIWNI